MYFIFCFSGLFFITQSWHFCFGTNSLFGCKYNIITSQSVTIHVYVICRPWSVCIEKNCALGVEYGPRTVLKNSGTVFLNTDRPRPAYNISLLYDPYSPARYFLEKPYEKSPVRGPYAMARAEPEKAGPARITYGAARCNLLQFCCRKSFPSKWVMEVNIPKANFTIPIWNYFKSQSISKTQKKDKAPLKWWSSQLYQKPAARKYSEENDVWHECISEISQWICWEKKGNRNSPGWAQQSAV